TLGLRPGDDRHRGEAHLNDDGQKPSRLRRAVFGIVLLLFPFPLALVYVLGIPLGWRWPYLLAYGCWIVFALFLDHVGTHHWPLQLQVAASRGIHWPHLAVMYVAFGLLFGWFLVSLVRLVCVPLFVSSVCDAV